MVWWFLAFFFLGYAILRAVKRGPDPAGSEPLGLIGTLRLGGIIMAWIVGGVIVLPLVMGLALLMFPS